MLCNAMAAKPLSSSRGSEWSGAGIFLPALLHWHPLIAVLLAMSTGCGWLSDQARKPKPCSSEAIATLPCTEEHCATMLDSGAVHIIRTSRIVDTIRSCGAPRLLMVVSSACPGIGDAMPRLLDEVGRAGVEPMVVFQDEVKYLNRARSIAMAAGWKGRLFALDQEECGCYFDNRERNRYVLDAFGLQPPELYHLASSLFILTDSTGSPIATSQYWEYPPLDAVSDSSIQPVARLSQ